MALTRAGAPQRAQAPAIGPAVLLRRLRDAQQRGEPLGLTRQLGQQRVELAERGFTLWRGRGCGLRSQECLLPQLKRGDPLLQRLQAPSEIAEAASYREILDLDGKAIGRDAARGQLAGGDAATDSTLGHAR